MIGKAMRFPTDRIRTRAGQPRPLNPVRFRWLVFWLRLRSRLARWRATVVRHFTS